VTNRADRFRLGYRSNIRDHASLTVFLFTPPTHPKGGFPMRKITMTLAAAVFVVGSMAIANAQTQGASSLNAQAKNATIIHQAACNGFWGRWCPPGRHRVCGPYRCWCAPCW
jgi:hypothetical protein